MNKTSFFKYFSIPAILLCACLSFAFYMAWKEIKIKNELVEQAIQGNSIAIEILIKYKQPAQLDERLVYEALAGNENAIKVLGISTH